MLKGEARQCCIGIKSEVLTTEKGVKVLMNQFAKIYQRSEKPSAIGSRMKKN